MSVLVPDNDDVIVELALHYCLYDSERINSCQTMTTFVLQRTMPYNDHVRTFVIPIFRSHLPLHCTNMNGKRNINFLLTATVLLVLIFSMLQFQEYLQSLHDLYENWLGNDKNHCWHRNTPVMVSN